MPDPWIISYGDIKLKAMLTNFKHTGFSEQEENWSDDRKVQKPSRILFAYTGAASMILAKVVIM